MSDVDWSRARLGETHVDADGTVWREVLVPVSSADVDPRPKSELASDEPKRRGGKRS
jgi:hypothetical protein